MPNFCILEPKKTVHLLNTLSNFYLYYDMIKDKVVEATNTVINKLDNLIEEKQQLQIENQLVKNHDIAVKCRIS